LGSAASLIRRTDSGTASAKKVKGDDRVFETITGQLTRTENRRKTMVYVYRDRIDDIWFTKGNGICGSSIAALNRRFKRTCE